MKLPLQLSWTKARFWIKKKYFEDGAHRFIRKMAHAHNSTVRGSVDLQSLVAEAEPGIDGADGGSSDGGGGGRFLPPLATLTRTTTMEMKRDLARGDLTKKRNALTERIKRRYDKLRFTEFPTPNIVLRCKRSKLADTLLKVAVMPPMQVGSFHLLGSIC